MGIVHAADLRPTKIELIAKWLPRQDWFRGGADELVRLGSFRFDDPDGEVGIETHIVGAGGKVYQVPLTYRGAPLEGAKDFLITTMEHSVLGRRWVYDATADPVYIAELAAALLTGKPQALEIRQTEGGNEILARTAEITSTGTPDAGLPELRFGLPRTSAGITTISTGSMDFALMRELDTTGTVQGERSLTVVWEGRDAALLLVAAIHT